MGPSHHVGRYSCCRGHWNLCQRLDFSRRTPSGRSYGWAVIIFVAGGEASFFAEAVRPPSLRGLFIPMSLVGTSRRYWHVRTCAAIGGQPDVMLSSWPCRDRLCDRADRIERGSGGAADLRPGPHAGEGSRTVAPGAANESTRTIHLNPAPRLPFPFLFKIRRSDPTCPPEGLACPRRGIASVCRCK